MTEGCQSAIGQAGQEGVDTCEPEARIGQAFSDLFPLPFLHAGTIMSSVVGDDTCIGHTFLLRREPLDFGRCAEKEQADTADKDSHRTEKVAHPSPRFEIWISCTTLADTVQCQA